MSSEPKAEIPELVKLERSVDTLRQKVFGTSNLLYTLREKLGIPLETSDKKEALAPVHDNRFHAIRLQTMDIEGTIIGMETVLHELIALVGESELTK